jgi:isoleucyl-tRNA synthetase
MRKEAGFEVMDHIEVGYEADDKVSGVFAAHSEEIASVVLADSITSGLNDGFKKDLNINGESVSLSVRRR